MRRGLLAVLCGAAVALTVSCSSTTSGTATTGKSVESPTSVANPAPAKASSAIPPVPPPAQPQAPVQLQPPAPAPQLPPPPAATGSITAYTYLASGGPASGVAINVHRIVECSPGADYPEYLSGWTDGSGTAYFGGLPIGCYTVSAGSPGEWNPSDYSVDVRSEDRDHVATFNAPYTDGPVVTDTCDPAYFGPQVGQQVIATTDYCDGQWLAYRNEASGPVRVATFDGRRWNTIAYEAGTTCLSSMQNQGSPSALDPYFDPRC